MTFINVVSVKRLRGECELGKVKKNNQENLYRGKTRPITERGL